MVGEQCMRKVWYKGFTCAVFLNKFDSVICSISSVLYPLRNEFIKTPKVVCEGYINLNVINILTIFINPVIVLRKYVNKNFNYANRKCLV